MKRFTLLFVTLMVALSLNLISWSAPVATLNQPAAVSDGTAREEVINPLQPTTPPALATPKDGKDGKDGLNGTNGTNGRDGKDGKDGLNGTNGRDGKDGTNGTNGLGGRNGRDGHNGRDGKDAAPHNHQGVYQSMVNGDPKNPKDHGWNIASKSYVDARDQKNLEAANKNTEEKLAEHEKKGAFPMWLWWLLGILLGLVLLAILLNLLWPRFWAWIIVVWPWQRRLVVVSDPEPTRRPEIVNTGVGAFDGESLGQARVEVHREGFIVRFYKAVTNVSLGTKWRFVPADSNENLVVNERIGSRLGFGLVVENLGRIRQSTEGIEIRDDFQALRYGRFIPGSGRLYVAGQCGGVLSDEFIANLLAGVPVDLADVIDYIPGSTSIIVAYQIEFRRNDGSYRQPEGMPPVEGGPTPNGPLFSLDTIEQERARLKAEADEAERVRAEAARVQAEQQDETRRRAGDNGNGGGNNTPNLVDAANNGTRRARR